MKKLPLIILILVIIGSIVYLEARKPKHTDVDSDLSVVSTVKEDSAKADKYQKAIEISTPDAFINTDGINIADLIGKKVIIVDFWTYSCINCQRTTPYLNAWYDRYSDAGLEIIGVHTPEFDFEKVLANVQNAVTEFGIKFPVVLDNDYSTWRSYKNRFWPRKYIIDIDGYIVYDHIGEGAYQETEEVIRKLLKERSDKLGLNVDLTSMAETPELASKSSKPNTPEIYFGADRNAKYLDNVEGGKVTKLQNIKKPKTVEPNKFALVGNWDVARENIESLDALSQLVLNFTAKKVFMVASAKEKTRVLVTLDGEPLAKEQAGKDIVFEQGKSVFYAEEEKLYSIFSADTQVEGKMLNLAPEKAGFSGYTFTFG